MAPLPRILLRARLRRHNIGICPCRHAPGRYYKLNLRALERHGTVEIRHPAGTQNAAKVGAFVLLALLLAEASISGRRAKVPKKGYAFENLLKFCSSNHSLAHWLPRRKLELNPKRTDSSSANSGAHSSGCGCAACRGTAVATSR